MATPIGTNRLLAYMEQGGEGAIVKPWVWILWLGAGPIAEAICFQFYIFLSVRPHLLPPFSSIIANCIDIGIHTHIPTPHASVDTSEEPCLNLALT